MLLNAQYDNASELELKINQLKIEEINNNNLNNNELKDNKLYTLLNKHKKEMIRHQEMSEIKLKELKLRFKNETNSMKSYNKNTENNMKSDFTNLYKRAEGKIINTDMKQTLKRLNIVSKRV